MLQRTCYIMLRTAAPKGCDQVKEAVTVVKTREGGWRCSETRHD